MWFRHSNFQSRENYIVWPLRLNSWSNDFLWVIWGVIIKSNCSSINIIGGSKKLKLHCTCTYCINLIIRNGDRFAYIPITPSESKLFLTNRVILKDVLREMASTSFTFFLTVIMPFQYSNLGRLVCSLDLCWFFWFVPLVLTLYFNWENNFTLYVSYNFFTK